MNFVVRAARLWAVTCDLEHSRTFCWATWAARARSRDCRREVWHCSSVEEESCWRTVEESSRCRLVGDGWSCCCEVRLKDTAAWRHGWRSGRRTFNNGTVCGYRTGVAVERFIINLLSNVALSSYWHFAL